VDLVAWFCSTTTELFTVVFCGISVADDSFEVVFGNLGVESKIAAWLLAGDTSRLMPKPAGTLGTVGVISSPRPVGGKTAVFGVATNGVVMKFHHPCDRRGVGTKDVSTAMGASNALSRNGVSSSSKTVPVDIIR